MERLTKWVDDGDKKFAITDPFIRSNGHQRCLTKLAEYEDLDISPEEMKKIYSEWLEFKGRENNSRIKMRFKVGDTVFVIWGLAIYEAKVERIVLQDNGILSYEWDLMPAIWQSKGEFYEHEISKSVFATREAAEWRLKELKALDERAKK